jgi:PadR family transcriptional regulator AphA
MLKSGPRTGYDLRREINAGICPFWSESYEQVYPTLHELVREGLASVSVEPGSGGSDRKVYRLREAGRDELRHSLTRPGAPQSTRNKLLLRPTPRAERRGESSRQHSARHFLSPYHSIIPRSQEYSEALTVTRNFRKQDVVCFGPCAITPF